MSQESKNIRHKFGESQPQASTIGFSAPPSRPEAFVPGNAHIMPSREELREMIRNRESCFGNNSCSEENEYMNNRQSTLSDNLIINCAPSNDSEGKEPKVDGMNVDDAEMLEDFHVQSFNRVSQPDAHYVTPNLTGIGSKYPILEPSDILESYPKSSQLTCTTTHCVESESHPSSRRCDDPPRQHFDITNIYANFGLPTPLLAPSVRIYMIIVNEIVLLGKEKDTLIIEYKPFKIYQHHLTCFPPGPGQWLPDDLMDYYLALITERNKSNPERYVSTYSFRSTFYALLSSASGLQLVEQTADGENIFENGLIFFPVCQNYHWRLVVADVAEQTVTAYNSLSSRPDVLIVKNIVRYLNHEYQRVNGGSEVGAGEPVGRGNSPPEWTTYVKLDVPQQDNGNDCGVFTLIFADYLSRMQELNFDVNHLTYFRAKMLYECISGRLLEW